MTSQDISSLILSTATPYGVDPRLALEVAMKESGLDNSRISSAGAIGIFQLMPATAADLGVDPTDPTQNIQGGVHYLSQMLSRYSGNVKEALGAYNWGPGNMDAAIAAHGAAWIVYAPLETQDYIQTILGNIGSQYTVSAASVLPLPGVPSTPSATSGLSFQTALWIGGAILAGWLVFSLLD